MKTNILKGVVLIGALALASCSTTNQLASTSKPDDDVYFSNAKAGDLPEYLQPLQEERYVNADATADDDDYYYYDSYASRINRFGYSSPFGYYDDYYYGYNNPYGYGAYGYGSPYGYGAYGGWGLGLGLSFGGGPWGGYSPYGYGAFGYSPYSYWGTGYGLGYGLGYPYWGVYSAYGSVGRGNYRPRPDRSFGTGGYANGTTSGRRVGYNGNYPNAGYYPGRASNSVGRTGAGGNASYGGGRQSRGVRNAQPQQPTYRPASVERPVYNPGNSGGGRSSGGGSSSGGGGGGARPVRP